jgi:hypothetical protein
LTAANRKSKLYSDEGGVRKKFNLLSDAAFDIPGTSSLTPAKVKDYTFDPSVDSGVYLAGRKPGSFIGRMSNQAPILVENLLSIDLGVDAAYRTFAMAQTPLVIFASNDGFLYAMTPPSPNGGPGGVLKWGYMPGSFVPSLKDFATFQGRRKMDGETRVVDVKVGAGYKRVVLGIADGGTVHYALEVAADGSLASVLWVDSHPTIKGTQAPQVYRTSTGTYAAYARDGVLRIRNIIGPAPGSDIALPACTGKLKALHLRNNIVLAGTDTGLICTGVLSGISIGTSPAPVTIDNTGSTSPTVTAIDTAVVNGKLLVVAQSEKLLSVYRRELNVAPTTNWEWVWSSFAGGSAPSTAIALPSNGRFSAPVTIASGVIFAPVALDPSGGATSCNVSDAQLYFYQLANGKFPVGQVISETGTAVTSAISVGQGEAFRVGLALMESKTAGVGASLKAFASAQYAGTNGSPKTLDVKQKPTQLIWWKETNRDKY